MANQAANRASLMMDGLAMASLPVYALQSTEWYRGAAVGIILTGTNEGYAGNTFDGTIPMVFAGVLKRRVTVPASSAQYYDQLRNLPLKRDGAVVFNAVTTAGNSTIPDATWLWKKVYFVSDNEVSLTAPAGFPIVAGRVIGINGRIGTSQVGSTEVLVAISDAVYANASAEEDYLSVGTLAASGSNQANAIANAPITKEFTQVTGADNAKGIALPTAVPGMVRRVKVSAAAGSTCLVYPQSGAAINAITANSAYTTAAVGAVDFIAFNSTQWYTMPLAG